MKEKIYEYNEDKEDKDKIDYLPPLQNMQYCKFLSLEKSDNSNEINYKMWIGEDKDQIWLFYNNCNLEKIKELMFKNTKVEIGNVECNLTIIPYAKASWFMHVNAQSKWMYFNKDIDFENLIKFAKNNFKKWYKTNANDEKTINTLFNRIKESKLFTNEGIKEFEEEFVNGSHAECNFTVSFACCIAMNYNDAMKLDKENKLKDTPSTALEVFRRNLNK